MSAAAFIILSSDEAEHLDAALVRTADQGFARGLVVDNASRDATAEVAARHGVECLTLPARVPYTEAMNRGLTRLLTEPGRPELVALLQADTFLRPGYLAAGRLGFEGRADVGSVAPKLLRAEGPGPEQQLDRIDAAGMTFDRRRKNSLVGHGCPGRSYGLPAEIFGADGAAALWRSEALLDCAVEGAFLDENMPGWGCDADLAWRAQLLGWHCVYAPAAVVDHIRTYSPTTRARAQPADRRTQFRNRLLMMAKNDTWADLRRDLGAILLYELLALGYALLREPELLGGYVEFLRRRPEARRQHRIIQARRRERRAPFGLVAPD